MTLKYIMPSEEYPGNAKLVKIQESLNTIHWINRQQEKNHLSRQNMMESEPGTPWMKGQR